MRCRVGCFFVKKKLNMLRLALDARWTNRMCNLPPYSRLAGPSALGRPLCPNKDADGPPEHHPPLHDHDIKYVLKQYHMFNAKV